MINRVIDIHQISPDDIRRIGESFFMEGGIPGKFNTAHFITSLDAMVKSKLGAVWVATDNQRVEGVMGGIAYPDLYTGAKCALETFWYVMPEQRSGSLIIRLLNEFERWATEENCQRIHISCLTGWLSKKSNSSTAEQIAKFFERLGYKPIETLYIKTLWQ